MSDRPPAEGERRAASGYTAQYRVAAFLIYRALRLGQLTEIRVADVDAGRVDDIQILRPERTDAYQVKWSVYPDTLTFHQLTTSTGKKPSLIKQLADGWQQLKALHEVRVVVHLLTNDKASVNDHLPRGTPAPMPDHFAAFLEQAWKVAKAGGMVPSSWGPAWDALRAASGLSPEVFADFVRDCELEIGFVLPEPDYTVPGERETVERDRRALAEFLFQTAGGPEQRVAFSRAELIERLGWQSRFRPTNRHEWPQGPLPYHPVASSTENLSRVLDVVTRGYVAVLGPPGSGKSTLLTETLRTRRERVIWYYAFVPDVHSALRGEAVHFLHDVVLALEDAGFRPGEAVQALDRTQLTERFHQQLQGLHHNWQETGRKTILLVDGLDHIEREQRPQRSLLADLSSPEHVPEGVVILLGSQTDQLESLPSGVQLAIRQSDRRVEMQPLDREAVYRIADGADLSIPLTREQRERVYDLSEGHPLALTYLLGRLRQVSTSAEMITALAEGEAYGGQIEELYHSYWRRTVEPDPELRDLLGLLARLRTGIDLVWVETWAGAGVVGRLRSAAAHYFREDGRRWYFHHNSFRLFLMARTAERSAGQPDEDRGRSLHRDLAERCAASETTPWVWEELYHRAQGGDQDGLLRRATQGYFRQQFEALRPPGAIVDDVRLALAVAADREDPVALARLLLAHVECADRATYLADASLGSILLGLGEHELAVQHARDGNRLLVSKEEALRRARAFAVAGLQEEGRRLFHLAEPHDLLAAQSPLEPLRRHDQSSLLRAWGRAAVHYRPVEEIVGSVRRLRSEGDAFHQTDAQTASRQLQNGILFGAGLELMESGRWEDWSRLAGAFDLADPLDQDWGIGLRIRGLEHARGMGDENRARDILAETVPLAEGARNPLDPDIRTALAQAVFILQEDLDSARKWLEGVDQPDLTTGLYSGNKNWQRFRKRFCLNRILYALGDRREVKEVVPDAADPALQFTVEFERDICRMARVWARAWICEPLHRSEVPAQVLGAVRRFSRTYDRSFARTDWHALVEMRSELYALLVNAVGQNGFEALDALRAMFEEEWANQGQFWNTELRRSVILELERAGVSPQWALGQLSQLEEHMFADTEVSARVGQCRKQAEAYLSVGRPEQARRWLECAVRSAVGIGYRKDYRMNTWIRWFGRSVAREPKDVAERISWFARAIVGMRDSTEDGYYDAAEELLTVAARWSPMRAVRLMGWLFDRRVLWHEEAIFIFLREALRAPTVPVDLLLGFVEGVLPAFARSSDEALVTGILKQVHLRSGRPGTVQAARGILAAMSRYALPTTRVGWRRCLGHALEQVGIRPEEAGLALESLEDDADETSTEALSLKDGTSLTRGEVRRRATSAGEVRALMEEEADDSLFGWGGLLGKSALPLSRSDVLGLADAVQGKRRGSQALACLSGRLGELGDDRGAWELAERALERSEPQGWSRNWDGGSRLSAVRALTAVDPALARTIAYRTFAADVRSGRIFFSLLVHDLKRLLAVFEDKVPVQAVWAEVEEHVHALFDGVDLPEGGPSGLDEPPESDWGDQVLVELLHDHLTHPCLAVAQATQRCVGRLLLQGNASAQALAGRMLREGEECQQPILQVLDAVSLRGLDSVLSLRDPILGLVDSPNFLVAQTARCIAGRQGWDCPPVAVAERILPLTYALTLETTGLELAKLVGNDRSSGPQEVDLWLDRITRVTGLPEQNLCYRINELMRGLGAEGGLCETEEGRLGETLKATGPKLQYRTRRTMRLRQAIQHLGAELVQAGGVGDARIDRLARALRCHDPALVLTEPGQRPGAVVRLSREDEYRQLWGEWVDDPEAAFESLPNVLPDGRIVLAEETLLRWLEWGLPTELRQSAVSGPRSGPTVLGEAEVPFELVDNRLVSEYAELGTEGNPPPLVLQNDPFIRDSPGRSWLALNPTVGRELGWSVATTGLFRWLDEHEEIMVESVWWVDGPLSRAPPQQTEVGEGWLVLASARGAELMRERYGPLSRLTRVNRMYTEDGEERWRSANRTHVVDTSGPIRSGST